MIPKKIHYCWFGKNKKPKLMEKCIASWKKYCPDYEIVEWNEETFEVDKYSYAKYCFKEGKWAFLSDFVRLVVIYEHGGIYLDTDVELIRNPDELLKNDAFFGFENKLNVATGLGFGAKAGQECVKAMMNQYLELQCDENGAYSMVICPALNTKALLPFGLKLNGMRQNLGGIEILPVDCLNPYNDSTGVLNITKNTYSIHRYSKSWMDKKTILRSQLTKPFHRLFGEDCFSFLKK